MGVFNTTKFTKMGHLLADVTEGGRHNDKVRHLPLYLVQLIDTLYVDGVADVNYGTFFSVFAYDSSAHAYKFKFYRLFLANFKSRDNC